MAILPVNGLNFNSSNKTKSSNLTVPFSGITHSNVQMKDTVSFGNIEEAASQKTVKVIKEIFTELTEDPNVCRSVDEEFITFGKKMINVFDKICTELLPSLKELELFPHSLEIGQLEDTVIQARNHSGGTFIQQIRAKDGKFLNTLHIDPSRKSVDVTTDTVAEKTLWKQAFYDIGDKNFQVKITRFTNSRQNEPIEYKSGMVSLDPCGSI